MTELVAQPIPTIVYNLTGIPSYESACWDYVSPTDLPSLANRHEFTQAPDGSYRRLKPKLAAVINASLSIHLRHLRTDNILDWMFRTAIHESVLGNYFLVSAGDMAGDIPISLVRSDFEPFIGLCTSVQYWDDSTFYHNACNEHARLTS